MLVLRCSFQPVVCALLLLLLLLHGAQGGELPRGQVGEILVKGPPVFKGYDRNAAATAGAFVGDGWFKTGGRSDRRSNSFSCALNVVCC